jgi:hypothetical protein
LRVRAAGLARQRHVAPERAQPASAQVTAARQEQFVVCFPSGASVDHHALGPLCSRSCSGGHVCRGLGPSGAAWLSRLIRGNNERHSDSPSSRQPAHTSSRP